MQESRQREPNLVAISGYGPNSRTIFCERRRNSISPAQHRVAGEISAWNYGFRTTSPPFITNTGFSRVVTSASGSPATAIMSP